MVFNTKVWSVFGTIVKFAIKEFEKQKSMVTKSFDAKTHQKNRYTKTSLREKLRQLQRLY